MAIWVPEKEKKEKDESDLEKVSKGLQLAGQLYGLYTDTQKVQAMKDESALKDAQIKEARAQFLKSDARAEAKERRDQEEFEARKKNGFRTPKDPWVEEAQRTRLQDQKDARTNAQVEKLQTKLSPLQDIQNAVSTVEGKMGFTLDQYDPATNKAGGKDVDLPGVSVPGLGRITAYSGEARDLDTAMSRVFNTELKDRSGAAVTTPELNRLRQEFGEGKFNTEQEKLQALKDYQRAATLAMKNVEAGYAPGAVDTYNDRGGMTSRNLPNPFKGAVTEEQVAQQLQGGNRANAGGKSGPSKLDALMAEKIRRKGMGGTIPK